jgi:hypothetical protein
MNSVSNFQLHAFRMRSIVVRVREDKSQRLCLNPGLVGVSGCLHKSQPNCHYKLIPVRSKPDVSNIFILIFFGTKLYKNKNK